MHSLRGLCQTTILLSLCVVPSLAFSLNKLQSMLNGADKKYHGPAKAVTLVSFDGAQQSTHTFKELNDPVMGGQSNGRWNKEAGYGVFSGEVKIVPKLKAPGFIEVWAPDGNYANAASAGADGELVLTVRSSTPSYAGYQVTIAAGNIVVPMLACAAGGSFVGSRGCFKAHFTVPRTEEDGWTTIRIPFTSFTDKWSPSTGKPTTTCAQDSSCCLTDGLLSSIKAVGFWGEGVAGKLHLEIQKVAAVPKSGSAN